ncbi:hypothetical protein ASD16_06560 [Cellulomonas sp. Root485]|uniref:hypothetical protein n=1 Tax=Cellulomonas sp. Root485 TaxID=1736546 RepID=UPI0006F641FF|nr:hypothetical protein [Cellulomonas sp. Root485]KQY25097.1 hypothetical protein ASD16_06560 [Cellulomonas sp. Root485]
MRRRQVLFSALRPHRQPDDGAGLVLVIGSMLILAMLAVTALTYSMSSQKFARYDQDYAAAMAAAQSGVEDFISRINRDDAYGYTPDCTNPAWKGSTGTNHCGWTATTVPGWSPVVPGETGPKAAWFHYSVDSSASASGQYKVVSTGRVNDVYRTVDVTVGKGGSTDYVYYTDFESADPANVQAYPTKPVKTICGGLGNSLAKYWWQGRSTTSPACNEIQFIGGDVLDGEVFTNDTILANANGSGVKPMFTKQVWTATPSCATPGASNSNWEDACLRAGSVANFNSVKPQYHKALYLPDSSAAFVDHPGCHYFGATRIIFSNDGYMRVWNAKSVNNDTPPVAVPLPGGTTPDCGTVAQLNATTGFKTLVPTEMVVYVAPSTAVKRQCYAGEIGGESGSALPLGTFSASKAAGPTSGSDKYKADANMLEATKYCNEGNLYAEGIVKGRVTLAAAQSIVVTGDLVLAGGANGPDMLGLVATNAVEIFHPRVGDVKATSSTPRKWETETENDAEDSTWPKRYKDPTTNTFVPSDGLQITGSIQTLQHSFLVQKYDVGGSAGNLMVWGSIAQRWRGIVGRGSNGYIKKYSYDPRLVYSAPPYFPKWANSKYSVRYSGEITTPTTSKP